MLARAPTARALLAATLAFLAGGAAIAACSSVDAVSIDDAGPAGDATTDHDASDEDTGTSCAVDAGTPDPALAMMGLQLVGNHKCENCHGSTLSGNNDGVPSPETQGGLAYPPNLTSDPATGLGCWTNAQIVDAILNGIDNQGMALCPPMPRFGHLTDGGLDMTQAEAVVAYLRSLPVNSNQVPNTPTCTLTADDAGIDAGADVAVDAAGDVGTDASRDVATDGVADATGDAIVEGGADASSDATDGALSAPDAAPEGGASGDAASEAAAPVDGAAESGG